MSIDWPNMITYRLTKISCRLGYGLLVLPNTSSISIRRLTRFTTSAVIVHKDNIGRKFLMSFGYIRMLVFPFVLTRAHTHTHRPYFDDVNAIIFIAAVSAFDQALEEDRRINRMRDSLELFNTICNHSLFKNTSIILFLNKIDILKKKLNKLQLKDYFKEYQGNRWWILLWMIRILMRYLSCVSTTRCLCLCLCLNSTHSNIHISLSIHWQVLTIFNQ